MVISLNILTIVSEPLAQRILKRMLGRAGYWPVIVTCEADALVALEHTIFDVMIIDAETLGLGSAQLVKLVRFARLGAPPLPVIALSSGTSTSVVRELKEIGVEAILAKPVPPKTLLETLTRVTTTQASSPGSLS